MNCEEQQPAFKDRPQRGELCHETVVVTPPLSLVVHFQDNGRTADSSKTAGDYSFSHSTTVPALLPAKPAPNYRYASSNDQIPFLRAFTVLFLCRQNCQQKVLVFLSSSSQFSFWMKGKGSSLHSTCPQPREGCHESVGGNPIVLFHQSSRQLRSYRVFPIMTARDKSWLK